MPQHPVPPSDLAGLVVAFAQTAQAVVDLGRGCTEDDFARHTECPWWSVQDQVSHVAALESAFAGEPPLRVEVPDLPHLRSDIARFMESGVHARRGRSGAEVVEELAGLLPRRIAALSDPALTLDTVIESAIGPRPAGAFVGLRVSDVWCHEQDIRAALDMPLALETAGAALFTSRVLGALPMIVARKAAVPVGQTVLVEVTGPVHGTAAVRVEQRTGPGSDGRPHGVVVEPDAGSGPVTRITLSTEAFTRRGAGRRDLATTPYAVSGDPAIAAAVVEHLVITP
jgi:uncharacterized protein (TIGR03083 family)